MAAHLRLVLRMCNDGNRLPPGDPSAKHKNILVKSVPTQVSNNNVARKSSPTKQRSTRNIFVSLWSRRPAAEASERRFARAAAYAPGGRCINNSCQIFVERCKLVLCVVFLDYLLH